MLLKPPSRQKLTPNSIDDIVFRNELLCILLGFKNYIPNSGVAKDHEQLYKRQLRWFVIPGIGNYNSAELRFHCDYNWLISAVIEFKKYDGLDKPNTVLYGLYEKLKKTNVLDIQREDLWRKLTDYAIAVWQQKQKEINHES